MFKYIIAFCILCVYKSESSPTGKYDTLVLNQQFPTTAFFYDDIYPPNPNSKTNNITNYLAGHETIFKAQDWVIQSLYAVDQNGVSQSTCTTASGSKILLKQDLLNGDLQQALTNKWPALETGVDDMKDWRFAYEQYGSCVTEDAVYYFNEALRLAQDHNVAALLGQDNMKPGNEYPLSRIVKAVESGIGKKVYTECISHEDSDKQYILGIRACFDNKHEAKDCTYQQNPCKLHCCDSKKLVQYPAVPAGYL